VTILCYISGIHFSCVVFSELHSNLESFDKTKPRTFILVSTVLTWARSKPLDPVRWFDYVISADLRS